MTIAPSASRAVSDTAAETPFNFTEKELEIAKLLRYYNDNELGEVMGVSHSRIRQYLERMKLKMGVNGTRYDLIRAIRDNNLE